VCVCVCSHIPPKGERKVALFDMSALVLQQPRYSHPMQRVSEGDGSVFFPMHKKVKKRVPAPRDVSRVLQCVAVCCSALQREMVVCYFQCIKRSKRQLLYQEICHVCCSVLQREMCHVCCSVLQCVAARDGSVLFPMHQEVKKSIAALRDVSRVM